MESDGIIVRTVYAQMPPGKELVSGQPCAVLLLECYIQLLAHSVWYDTDRAQQFELSYGKAYVFYPEVSDERTTAALLLDIDPLDLARGKVGSRDGGLFDYVNDRPYACTSFMSTAIARVFGTAMTGRCDTKQQLADTPLKLTATLYSLKDKGFDELSKMLFEPLGYTVETHRTKLDEKFPEWDISPYIDLTISGTDPVFMQTPYLCVDTSDEKSVQAGVDWWLELTAGGGEGMVVKPETFTAMADGKLLQPAVKCRGREYLRIIYGAEYLQPTHLKRLKVRSLNRKRNLALKEFSLGMESLSRFVNNEPLYKVHECSFAVLALESEPVDPRL